MQVPWQYWKTLALGSCQLDNNILDSCIGPDAWYMRLAQSNSLLPQENCTRSSVHQFKDMTIDIYWKTRLSYREIAFELGGVEGRLQSYHLPVQPAVLERGWHCYVISLTTVKTLKSLRSNTIRLILREFVVIVCGVFTYVFILFFATHLWDLQRRHYYYYFVGE